MQEPAPTWRGGNEVRAGRQRLKKETVTGTKTGAGTETRTSTEDRTRSGVGAKTGVGMVTRVKMGGERRESLGIFEVVIEVG